MHQRGPVGIILAAGRGRRFDASGVRNKLTQRLANGTPVVLQVAQTLSQVLSTVMVVACDPDVAAHCHFPGCRSWLFPAAGQGMGASLAFAVSTALQHEPDAESMIIALGDMPFVQTETITRIARALQSGAGIVQPVYRQQPGHPVGFSKQHFAALMALNGDTGARYLLQQCAVNRIDVSDPGVIRDIDYPSDLI